MTGVDVALKRRLPRKADESLLAHEGLVILLQLIQGRLDAEHVVYVLFSRAAPSAAAAAALAR